VKPTLKNIRTATKKPGKPDPYAKIMRRISVHITWLLVRTPITANQVTLFQGILGLAGAILLAYRPILGVILLQLGYLLDLSDGEVARWRGTASKSGHYLDMLGHIIVVPCMFFGLGYGAWVTTGRPEAIIAAFVAALFSMKLDYYAAVWTGISEKRTDKHSSGVRRFAEILLRYPWTMNIITVVVILDRLTPISLAYFATVGFAVVHVVIRAVQAYKRMEIA